jgi:pilus assembly protein Flp/PilA
MSALVLRVYAAVVCRLGDTRRGATAIEYGLMIALVAAVCIAGFTLFGNANSSLYNKLATIAGLLH